MSAFNPPRSQGLKSSTFTQPPSDPTLSFPALYDWQGQHSHDHPLFLFEDEPGTKRSITWGEAKQGFHRATRYVRGTVGHSGAGSKPLIAVLATSDSISFFSFIIGTFRTGWTLFPLSPRNSPQAVAHLLSKSGATHIFVSAEASLHSLADAAISLLDSSHVQKCAMPTFDLLFPTRGVDPTFVPEPLGEFSMEDNGLVLHSSGTTSFPKPIYLKHTSLHSSCFLPCWGEVDMAGSVVAMHAVPLFHGMGMFGILYALTCGFTMAVFKPQSPATVPNPSNTIEAAISDYFDYVLTTPTFVETWAQEPKYVRALAASKGAIYGGGPLSREAGDYLVSQGVDIHCFYASTEVMGINTNFTKSPGKDWEYFKISPTWNTHLIDHGQNEFELVLLESENSRPNVINTKIDGCDGYATSDLISPHPTKPGFWKVVGRTDDQIMHSTGEKTNPGPLEAILSKDPFVQGAMIFGRGRFHAGVLVQPKAPFEFDPADMKKMTDFRNLIWPTIERINEFAPTHSRIFKEMILVTSPSKPLLFTPKGTLRRKVTLEQYTEEIDALYKAVDESAQEDISGPVDWSIDNAIVFVRNAVEKTMKKGGRDLTDSADLFEFGLDSLQATWIRNTLLRALRQAHPSIAREIPSTFIYDHPSIASLAKYLSNAVTGEGTSTSEPADKRRELFELVDKYTASFPQFASSPESRTGGDIVLLTGGTGSLGSNILARLIETPEVVVIYSLSRRSSDGMSVEERQWKSFEREGLDEEMLQSSKLRMLEGDPSLPEFGLPSFLYQELRSTVTHIIHNAWRVNFDLAVASFESNIRSVRNFVDFSLNGHGVSPARVLFISSIGVLQSYNGPRPAPEVYLSEPDGALGLGYAESKWVSEHILRKASEETPISTTVLRCGQMTGGPSGAWNEHEWLPSLVKSSVALGKLPATGGSVSWITGYDAAGAIVDSLHVKAEPVLHVLHPRPTAWNELMEAFSQQLNIPTVPYANWFSVLEESQRALQAESAGAAAVEKTLRENPALRLLEFFRAGKEHENDENYEPPGLTKISCVKTASVSESLRSAKGMGEENVKRWVSAWRKSGFL